MDAELDAGRADVIDRIIYLRKSHKLSQAKFAQRIGVSSGNVGEWERRKSLPGLQAISNISREFNRSADWLLFGADDSVSRVPLECQTCFVNELSIEDIFFIKRYLQFIRWQHLSEESNSPPK